MRIAIINSEFPPVGGGSGNASAHLAKEFTKLGHEVIVITTQYHGEQRKEIIDGYQIIRIPAIRNKPDRSNPFEQFTFLLGSSTTGLANLSSWNPDIVIAFFGLPSGPAAYFHKLLKKKPFIVSLRGGDVPGFRPDDFGIYHKLSSPAIRKIWDSADKIVANSSGLKELALTFYPGKKIAVITNGVDPQKYPIKTNGWEDPTLLFTGRLVYQKGLDVLLNSLAQLIDVEFNLYIVGDGPEKEHLQELTRKLKLEERIHFTGWLNKKELIDYYQQASIFVFPSRQEGMPNSMLEAMASGLPVIATKISGSEELILDGKGGYLVRPDNQDELKNALDSLLANNNARENMGRYNRQRVMEIFSWSDIARKYEELIKTVVEQE